MSRRAEVWTQPDSGSFVKRIADLPWERVGFNRELSKISSGQITVPSIYRRIDEIVNPSANSGSLIRIFEGSENVASFYATDADFDEEEHGTVTISGSGIEFGLDGGIVYPWDWTPGATETLFPDWVYGLGNNEITDPGFEDNPTAPLQNGDAELGDMSGWSTRGDVDLFEVVNNPANAYEGDFFFKIDPLKYHAGIKQTVKVYPGKRNQFTARLKEPGALAKRFTFGASVESGYTTYGLNQFVYNEEVMAELGNVSRSNGSSDGTWQLLQLDIEWGDEQEETTIFTQFDHHREVDGTEFWVDAVTMSGFGVGVGDWECIGLPYVDTFEGSTDEAHSGTRSLKLVMNGVTQPLGGAGISLPVVFEEGAPFVAEVWVRTPTGGTPTVNFSARQADGGSIIDGAQVDLVADTWTKLELAFEPADGILHGFVVLAWDETTAGTLYVDDLEFRTGLPAANAGYIVKQHMDAITTRAGGDSALLWLKYDSITALVDSNGVDWPEELRVRVPRGQTMRQLLDQLNSWGYEWEVVWNSSAGQYELKFYTKYTGTSGGAGQDNTIKLTKGKSFRQGRVRLRDPGANTFLGEGLEGSLLEKQDTALATDYGRKEGYLPKRDTADGTTIESMIDHAIVESKNQKYGVKATLFERPLPVLDFSLGSKIEVDIPPQLPRDAYRVVGFTGAWHVKDDHSVYTLDFSSRVYEAPFGGTTSTVTSDALNYLLGKFEGLPDVDRLRVVQGAPESVKKESVPTLLLAASNARQEVKNHADIVCSGADDEESLQVSIDTIESEGSGIGRLQMSEGHLFVGSGAVITFPLGISLFGVGMRQTVILYPQAGTPPRFVVTGENELADFSVQEETC